MVPRATASVVSLTVAQNAVYPSCKSHRHQPRIAPFHWIFMKLFRRPSTVNVLKMHSNIEHRRSLWAASPTVGVVCRLSRCTGCV